MMLRLLTAIALTALSTFAMSKDSADVSVHNFVARFGGVVVASKPSALNGYMAYLAEKDGKQRMFYRSRDGAILYGLLYDADGVNITERDLPDLLKVASTSKPVGQALESLTPAADVSRVADVQPSAAAGRYTPEQAYYLASTSNYIQEGRGQRVIYVVFDPNCPYCKDLYARTRNYLTNANIRWIPVGVVARDSKAKAAAVISKGIGAMPLVVAGTLQPISVSPEMDGRLLTNVGVLVGANSTHVPTLLYKEPDGVHVFSGAPSDSELRTIVFGR